MQKFEKKIFNILTSLLKSAIDIKHFLEEKDLDAKGFEKLADLYSSRQILIEEFKNHISPNRGMVFENKDKEDEFNLKYKKLLKIEKINLDEIARRKDESREKLKTLNKQKSVLLYQK